KQVFAEVLGIGIVFEVVQAALNAVGAGFIGYLALQVGVEFQTDNVKRFDIGGLVAPEQPVEIGHDGPVVVDFLVDAPFGAQPAHDFAGDRFIHQIESARVHVTGYRQVLIAQFGGGRRDKQKGRKKK